ncbi:MAG TPA: alpha/beta hydrolase [Acidisarcina sp.]
MVPVPVFKRFLLCMILVAAAAASACAQTTAAATPAGATPELVRATTGQGMELARAVESFTILSLKGSVLNAEPPLLGSREVTADFVRELYQLRWRPNDPIDLYVILPRNVRKPPVSLYLYGYPSETDRFKDDRYCKRVVHNGVAAVGFVSALTGHRDDFRPPTQNLISQLPEALATTTHDVQMILDYLETRKDLDMNNVGMFGQGSGGAIAVLAAAADPRIKVLDLLDPWGDWPTWVAKAPDVSAQQRSALLEPGVQKQLEPLEPVHYLPQLKTRKVRLQFVDQAGEPREAVHSLEMAASPDAQIIHYPTGHAMWISTSDGRLFEWLAAELKKTQDSKPGGISARIDPAR